jgi:hypothetical protein
MTRPGLHGLQDIAWPARLSRLVHILVGIEPLTSSPPPHTGCAAP